MKIKNLVIVMLITFTVLFTFVMSGCDLSKTGTTTSTTTTTTLPTEIVESSTPNDTTADAVQIYPGIPVKGFMERGTWDDGAVAYDFYKFTIPAGKSFKLHIKGSNFKAYTGGSSDSTTDDGNLLLSHDLLNSDPKSYEFDKDKNNMTYYKTLGLFKYVDNTWTDLTTDKFQTAEKYGFIGTTNKLYYLKTNNAEATSDKITNTSTTDAVYYWGLSSWQTVTSVKKTRTLDSANYEFTVILVD